MRRLKAAGAIVLAKTNTPEFACGANTNNALFGPTRNPWNPALSPAALPAAPRWPSRTHAADRAGHRFRLLDPHSGRVLRHCRHSPDARPDAELSDAACLGSGQGAWSAGARRRRRRADARCPGRLSAGFRRSRSRRPGRARWPSSSAARTSRACASPMSPTLPASASTRRSTRSAATPRPPWQTRRAGRADRIRRQRRPRALSDLARLLDGRPAIRAAAQIEEFGPNLKGNVEAGLKLTAIDLRRRRAARGIRCSIASISCSSATMCC